MKLILLLFAMSNPVVDKAYWVRHVENTQYIVILHIYQRLK